MLMTSLFWSRVHGGMTHFPIALVLGAAFFEMRSVFFCIDPRSSANLVSRGIGSELSGAIGIFRRGRFWIGAEQMERSAAPVFFCAITCLFGQLLR